MLHEFWENFTHNLFKPLLLFFYFGFLIPILKVRFEFPYVIYQGLTMYLLLAIGWHGGEELAKIDSGIGVIIGFMVLGFVFIRRSIWICSRWRIRRSLMALRPTSGDAGGLGSCPTSCSMERILRVIVIRIGCSRLKRAAMFMVW